MKKIRFLCKALKIVSVIGDSDLTVSNIQYDSRKCTEGTLFVALSGSVSDGHKYIDSSIESGAKAIICENLPKSLKNGITYILVDNSRKTLALISHAWYDEPTMNMNIIGITGTNGKTTITFLFKQIFMELGVKTGIIGTTGIFIDEKIIPATHTTPESLELAKTFREMADLGINNVIMEVSSHALSQHRVDGIKFNTGIFTNLTIDHLDYHKTLKEYASAKKILFDMLPVDSSAIVFDNSEYTEHLLSNCKSEKKYIISRNKGTDITISNEVISFNGSSFQLDIKNFISFHYETKLMGRFNIDNSAITVAWFVINNYNTDKIKEALKKAIGAPGRMQRIDLNSGAIAFVDYAHTPDALEKAMKTCREILNDFSSESRLITVFGCGGDRDKTKRPIMGRLSLEQSDFTIITNDNPRTEEPEKIINDIIAGISKEKNHQYIIIHDRKKAISEANNLARKGDIILVAGKGHEDYQIIGERKEFFDDVKELLAFT